MNLKSLNVAICDDETSSLTLIKEHLIKFQIQHDLDVVIHTFSSSNELLDAFAKTKYTLVFLDIEMPGMDGLSLSRQIRNRYPDDVYIIFVTSYPSYMHDSFEVQPYQYLLKPVTYEVIDRTMTSLISHFQNRSNTRVVVDMYNEKQLIDLEDILYICTSEGQKQYLDYVFHDDRICCRGTLSALEPSLSEFGFIMTNRSSLVNTRHILSFDDQSVTMDNGDVIRISRRNLKNFRIYFAKQIILKME